ncbi:MAG: N-acetylmuramoyl-L-alanine amidase, partial [Cyanobacteria bacterium J06649_11]
MKLDYEIIPVEVKSNDDGSKGLFQIVKRQVNTTDKILFLSANPTETARLALDKEFVAISQSLQSAVEPEKYSVKIYKEVSVKEFTEHIIRERPSIIHFTGHGADTRPEFINKPDQALPSIAEEKEAGIILTSEDTHGPQYVNTSRLKRIFEDVIKTKGISIRVVILNASYSEELAEAISEYIPYVIGISKDVSDQAAISFARGFYFGLGQKMSIQESFEYGSSQSLAFSNSEDQFVMYRGGEKILLEQVPQKEETSSSTFKQNFLWCLDSGHGIQAKTKKSPVLSDGTQFFEYEFNRDIVARIMDLLKKEGIDYFEVVPEVDADIPLAERVKRANEKESELPKIYLSVHANAGPPESNSLWTSADHRGIETWYIRGDDESQALAIIFQKHIVERTGFHNRHIKSQQTGLGFYVLRQTDMPAIMTENGFYNNKDEVRELMKDNVRQQIAEAHVAAILD